jgi:hypothetical protein
LQTTAYLWYAGFMSAFDWLMLVLGLLGLVAPYWLDKMPWQARIAVTLAGLAALAYSGLAYLQEATLMKIQPGPLSAIILGLVIIACGLTWQMHLSKAQTMAPRDSAIGDPAQPYYGGLERAMKEALADPRYTATTKLVIQHKLDLLPFKREYRETHANVSLAQYKSPEGIAFFNQRLREAGKDWQITGADDPVFGNVMLDSSMRGALTGILIEGGGGNTFDQTDIDALQTGVHLRDTKGNQFGHTRINTPDTPQDSSK